MYELENQQIAEYENSESMQAVHSADLLAAWNLGGGVAAAVEGRPWPNGFEAYNDVCHHRSNIPTLWDRLSMLVMMTKMKLLEDWIHDGELDVSVIRALADYPMTKVLVGRHKLPLDVDGFLKQIRKRV